VFGLCIIVFGLSRSFYLSLAMLVLLGAADMFSVVISQTLVQIATPDAIRGRVSAVNMLFRSAPPTSLANSSPASPPRGSAPCRPL